MSLGFSAGRYTTVAASFGYYKFEGSDGPVLPIGLDFSFMDLGAQKISPYINIAGYFPYYDVVENTSRPGMNSSISTNGVYLFKFGGGIACTLVKGKKLIFSGGYAPSQFKYKSRVTVVSGTSTHTNTSTGNIKTQNYYASMEFFL
jgi:hypothetical protein